MKQSLYGLVLCGGKSSRMGFDKGSITVAGLDLRTRSFRLLENFCEKVFFSCSEELQGQVSQFGDCIVDLQQGLGPSCGLFSAHEKYPERSWLVLPCDMPLVGEHEISKLVENRNPANAATVYFHSEAELLEPLVAIWEVQGLESLAADIGKGHMSPRRSLEALEVTKLKIENGENFQSLNTPEQYLQMAESLGNLR